MLYRFILLCSLIFVFSCSGPQIGAEKTPQARPGQAVLTLYMSASGAAEMDVAARLEEVAIEVDGAWIGLGLSPIEVSFLELKGQQQLLGAAVAPLGEHRQVRLTFIGLPSAGTDQSVAQVVKLTLPEPLELTGGSSRCLFVDWQLISQQLGSKDLFSSFSARGQGQILGGELLYVACSGIDTIYLLRMDSNEVVSAFAIPGPIADIRLRSSDRRLYILSRGRRSIYVYDCLNSRLIDQIALTGSLNPQEMTLAPDGRYAYVVDDDAGTVFKVELAGGQVVAQQRIGHRPQRISYLDSGQGRLAIAASNSNQVFILSADDLKIQRSISVGSRPAGLLYFADALYVSESGSQSVSVFDFSSGKQIAKISVGSQPDSLIRIDQNNAYVSNSGERSLTALSAGQKVAFRRIPTAQNPTEMVYSERKRLLYVLNPKINSISVIERDSEQLLRQIGFGGPPQAMAVLE